jgi:hypothetical protein
MNPELISRYRAQDFNRDVVDRSPVDLDRDEVTLSCGHKKKMNVNIIEAAAGRLTCKQCAEEWLAKERAGNGDGE